MSFMDLLETPEVHVRLGAWWREIGRSEDGASLVVRSEAGDTPAIGAYVAEFEAANARLVAGAPLADLRDQIIAAAGGARAAAYLILLQRLCRFGFIEFALMEGLEVRALIAPQWESYVPSLALEAPAPEAELSRFACLRRHDGAWLLESPLCGARFRFPDLAALDAPLVRRAVAAAGFFEDAAAFPEGGPRETALAQWEFHDLVFHTHHRVGWHRDPLGAMFPYIDEIEPLPAARPSWPGERIALPRAPNGSGEESFAEVLERRRSERYYDEAHPISRNELGALLDRAARIRWSDTVSVGNFLGRTTRFEISRRPYPNGGASYELELYPVVDRCEGIDPGLYHYDAATHELVRVCGRTPEVERMVADAKGATAFQADPQIVLVIAARFARVMWKYKSISYGVILRNTGALYQTLYLAATELGLSPCGIGSGNSELFARVTGLDPVIEGSVGDFILGGRPRAA